MWLIIRREDSAVIGTQYGLKPTWNEDLFEVKEWYGKEPPIHDPEEGIYSYDPTLDDPEYPGFTESRLDFNALADLADSEIDWLNETIPQIDVMTAERVRDVVKRLAQENLRQVKAWRYIFRRL